MSTVLFAGLSVPVCLPGVSAMASPLFRRRGSRSSFARLGDKIRQRQVGTVDSQQHETHVGRRVTVVVEVKGGVGSVIREPDAVIRGDGPSKAEGLVTAHTGI